MTSEQFEKYKKTSEELRGLKRFLIHCNPDIHSLRNGYPFRIRSKPFALEILFGFGNTEDNTFDISKDLQKKIVELIQLYVIEKEKELENI